METDKDYSLHETSHAVVAWYLGAKINNVTIVGPRQTHGSKTPFYCEIGAPGMVQLAKLTQADIDLRIAVGLAPFGLQRRGHDLGAIGDIVETMSFLSWHRRHQEMATKAANLLGSDDPAASEFYTEQAYLARFEKPAVEFFEQFGRPVAELLADKNVAHCIEALANKLLEKGRLTGFEVASFLESHWVGPLPEKALPVKDHAAGVATTSPENAIESVTRLTRMSLAILREIDNFDAVEAPMRAILQCIFQLEECSAKNS